MFWLPFAWIEKNEINEKNDQNDQNVEHVEYVWHVFPDKISLTLPIRAGQKKQNY